MSAKKSKLKNLFTKKDNVKINCCINDLSRTLCETPIEPEDSILVPTIPENGYMELQAKDADGNPKKSVLRRISFEAETGHPISLEISPVEEYKWRISGFEIQKSEYNVETKEHYITILKCATMVNVEVGP